MTKKIILSGIQPTGIPHLGNYFGAIKNHIELSKDINNQVIIIIADYHALTTIHDSKELNKNIIEIYKIYTALGFNFSESNIIIRQSSIPELTELAWIFSCVSGKGILDRAHAFKAKSEAGLDVSCGLYFYPILMAADILMFDADFVPVGKDQHQHVQIAQQIAIHFNEKYKNKFFKNPEPLFSSAPIIYGTDGIKMSKSLNNTIPIFSDYKQLDKIIKGIKTDSTPFGQALDIEKCNVLKLINLFYKNKKDYILFSIEESYRTGKSRNIILQDGTLLIKGMPKSNEPFGYGAAKEILFNIIVDFFKEYKNKYDNLIEHDIYFQLPECERTAKYLVQKKIAKYRELCGLKHDS